VHKSTILFSFFGQGADDCFGNITFSYFDTYHFLSKTDWKPVLLLVSGW
jgi:hypothetical protein